jgi:hypothetical protein
MAACAVEPTLPAAPVTRMFADPRHVNMRNEVVGVGAREHEYLARVVGIGSLNQ